MRKGTLVVGAILVGLALLLWTFRAKLRALFAGKGGASATAAAPGLMEDVTGRPVPSPIAAGGNARSRVGLRNAAEGAAGTAVAEVIGAAGGAASDWLRSVLGTPTTGAQRGRDAVGQSLALTGGGFKLAPPQLPQLRLID